MGYSLAIGPTLVQLPPSRALVPQSSGKPPRVEEVLGTARVVRHHQDASSFHSRATRHGTLQADADRKPALSLYSETGQETPTVGHLSAPGASPAFVAQVLGQAGASGRDNALRQHRNGPELSSIAYRQAGGEPALYAGTAALFRLAV